MRLFPGLPALACLLVVVAAKPAQAGLSARLVYLRSGAAESCPDQGALKKAVARRLGYDPFFVAAPYTVVAEIADTDGNLQARARLLDDAGIVLGSREMRSAEADCGELLASLALAISLTLDPMALALETESDASATPPTATVQDPHPAETPNPAQPSVPKPVARREPTRAPGLPSATPPSARSARLYLSGSMVAAMGFVPSVSPGLDLGGSLRRGPWSLALDAVALLPQTRNATEGYGAEVSLAYAAVSPCIHLGYFKGCTLATVGRYSAKGIGVDSPREGHHLHAGAGIRTEASLPVSSRWSVGARAEGVRVLTRPDFLVSGHSIYRPPGWAANIGIFAQWQIQ